MTRRAVPGTDVTRLHRWLDEQTEAMTADLVALATSESPTDDVAALRSTLALIRNWMQLLLGPPSAETVTEFAANGPLWVADYVAGGTDHADTDVTVALLCHYDTVWPIGTLASWPVSVDGDRITGPGVFDMKAGIVQAVWAVKALREAGLAAPHLRFVFNADEEVGSPATTELIAAASAGASAVLVFEPSGGGAVKTARKGMGIFRVEVTGVEAHAGLDPGAGASAIDEMARVVLRLRALERLELGTSVNIGTVAGGTRTNVVAGRATASVDARIRTSDEAARIVRELAQLSASDPRVRITVDGGWIKPPMERTPAIAGLYELATELAAHLGLELREISVGGASDGNGLARLGLAVLDGLGAVGDGAHARGEYALISRLAERSALAAALLRALAEG